MFYQIVDHIKQIEFSDIDSSVLTFGLITLDELDQYYLELGFSPSTVNESKNGEHHIHGSLDIYDEYHFGIISGIDVEHFVKSQDQIAIYIKNNLLLIVIIDDDDDSIIDKLFDSVKYINTSRITLERLIYGFLEKLVYDNYVTLERIESELSNHEDQINDNHLDKDFHSKITSIRKKLLFLDNYYEQLIMIGEELEENGLDIFKDENLRFFKLFTAKVTRLSNNTRMLQDYSIHVRDAYHAQLDYNLNNIMKLFTAVTTIFLPLTLIVGWYGMNFTYMPELSWKYGYLLVIAISITVVLACLFYYKKKKFL